MPITTTHTTRVYVVNVVDYIKAHIDDVQYHRIVAKFDHQQLVSLRISAEQYQTLLTKSPESVACGVLFVVSGAFDHVQDAIEHLIGSSVELITD